MLMRFHYCYCVFDAEDDCLYVGMTGYVGERGIRWSQHKRTNPEMTSQANHFKLYGPYTFHGAQIMERKQLLLRRPRFNRIPKWLEDRAGEYLGLTA